MNVQASDLGYRQLSFSGQSIVSNVDDICSLIFHGCPIEQIAISDDLVDSKDVEQFNTIADVELGTPDSSTLAPALYEWQMPAEYAELDLREYVFAKFKASHAFTSKDADSYESRLENELAEIARRDLSMMVKCLIYVIATLRAKNEVWGVGRGSSCASLVLYLIGLHCVDPVKFGIPMYEFFHD